MEVTLAANSLVWAKLSGHPWWPGFIKSVNSDDMYEVEYFGDFSRSFLSKSKLKPFSENPSASEKRNPRLCNSYAMALRVYRGQSDIEKEKKNVEGKLSLKIPPVSKNKSQLCGSTNSLDDQSDLMPFKKQMSSPHIKLKSKVITPKGEKTSRPKHHKHVNLNNDQIFYDDSEKSESFEKSKKSDMPKANPKPDQPPKKLRLTKFHSRIPKMDLSKQEECEMLHNQSIEMSLESLADPDLERIKTIETKLEDLIKVLGSNLADLETARNSLGDIQNSILSEEQNVHKMHDTKIGSLLVNLQGLLIELQKQDCRFSDVLTMNTFILKTIKRKLLVNFFKTNEFDRKVMFSSTEKENSINLGKSHEGIVRSGFSNERVERESKSAEEVLATSDNHQNNSSKIKRVCKKLAKILYSKSKTIGLKKSQSESISQKIESTIRKNSKSSSDYDRKILQIHEQIQSSYQKLVDNLAHSSATIQMKTKIQKIQSFLFGNVE